MGQGRGPPSLQVLSRVQRADMNQCFRGAGRVVGRRQETSGDPWEPERHREGARARF